MNRFLNLNMMAFTTYGSSMTLTRKQNAHMGFNMDSCVPDGYYFHPIYDAEMFSGLLFKLSFEGLASIDMQFEFNPEVLRLFHNRESIRVCFPDRVTMRFAGCVRSGFILDYDCPRKGDTAFALNAQLAELNVYTKKCMLYAHKGTIKVEAPWDISMQRSSYVRITVIPDANGEIDFCLEEFDRGWKGIRAVESFDYYVEASQKAFEDYCASMPSTDNPHYMEAFEACNYMAWAYTIYDNGYFHDRETILLSKNWMALSASWDNTFNMLPLAAVNQKRGFDQLFTIMDYQEPTGAQPDWITSHRFNHSYLKPPVTGAVLNILLDDGVEFDNALLRKTCAHLEKIIDFWMKYRDYDHDGIPEYGHGNDSGCDNCTVFDIAPNVESPDLTAYIIADYDFLGRCEMLLGNPDKAAMWKRKADELFERLILHSYDPIGHCFVSPISGTHKIADGDAMINFMPIILAYRMPSEMKRALVEALRREDRFYTRWGYASESVSSQYYQSDSYWRGPIWAPQMFFIVEGLRMAGETAHAHEAAQRYVDLCMHAGCFAENFDALNGIGLRDTSYSWAANVFQYFVLKYC